MKIQSCTYFTLYEYDLKGCPAGQYRQSLMQAVPRSGGLQWWIMWYPAGRNEATKGHVYVYLYVNKPVKATCTFAVVNSPINCTFNHEFIAGPSVNAPLGYGPPLLSSHAKLRSFFRNGTLTVTCNVEFDVPFSLYSFKPFLFHSYSHLAPDFELVLASGSIAVHRCFLSMLSPVFHAMLTHDTIEARTGKAEIKDFDFETTKAAMDFCYGRKVDNLSIETVISILRFADKYDMKAVVDPVERSLFEGLCLENFCAIVSYASEFARENLMKACAAVLNANRVSVTKLKDFANLPPETVCAVLRTACEL